MSLKNNNINEYQTIKEYKRTEIKIKASRFIGTATPVKSREEAEEKLNDIRSEFYDANHNCYAYKIGYDEKEFRYSDDGEPSGSAGKPIYFTLDKFDLSDILLVVTRYFGGTKLGVGGLVRAYSDSAENVLNQCEQKTIHRTKIVEIETDYHHLGLIKRILDKEAISFEEEYTDKVMIKANLPLTTAELFVDNIFNSTESRIQPKIIGEEEIE